MQIAILLATYNSEKYLKTQIDSVMNQTYKNFNLYIRDDGSNDSTLMILNEYLENFSNIFILHDKVTLRKSMGSFMWMLENVKADYYMFCDHDDYWLQNKIKLTFEKMLLTESINPSKPIIIHTDLKVVNDDLQEICSSFWSYSKIKPFFLLDFNYLAVYNALTGCTMMINSKARTVSLPISSLATMHDTWIGLKVVASGGIINYITSPTILYRQHTNNVVGAKEVGTRNYIYNKIKTLKEVLKFNRERLKMLQQIRSFSVYKYIFYKFSYIFKK
jgi:glycosyltransferase involved in cell wall biosynthesis